MSQRAFRVMVVDDHCLFAEALAALLDDEPDLSAEAMTSLPVDGSGRKGPATEVLLLAGSAAHLVAEALAVEPHVGVIVVGERDDPLLLAAAIRAGAMGWLTKTSSPEASVAAVRAVAQGDLRIPSELVVNALQAATTSEGGSANTAPAALTVREEAVLRCLADGMTRSEVAVALGVSVNTVRTHIQNILGKLGVRSALAGVAVARRCGLVT